MLRWIVYILALISANAAIFYFLATELFPAEFVVHGGIKGYLIIAAIFSAINTFIKPILKIITLPIRFFTLGAFSLVLNGVVLWMMEASVNFLELEGVETQIEGWIIYLGAGLILAIFNTVLHWFISPIRD